MTDLNQFILLWLALWLLSLVSPNYREMVLYPKQHKLYRKLKREYQDKLTYLADKSSKTCRHYKWEGTPYDIILFTHNSYVSVFYSGPTHDILYSGFNISIAHDIYKGLMEQYK